MLNQNFQLRESEDEKTRNTKKSKNEKLGFWLLYLFVPVGLSWISFYELSDEFYFQISVLGKHWKSSGIISFKSKWNLRIKVFLLGRFKQPKLNILFEKSFTLSECGLRMGCRICKIFDFQKIGVEGTRSRMSV